VAEERQDILDAGAALPAGLEEDGAEHVHLKIRKALPARRIDKYLAQRFSHVSRNVIQGLIEEQAVRVNGRGVKCSYQLKAGDELDVILPPPPVSAITPEPIPLDVLYEDEDLLAVNKPADLIVHPARGNRGGTLANALAYYSASLSHVNGAFRPGIVHRLDRNTTGVIVVAKTDAAHWRLAHQFEHRLVRKEYLAVVHGTMELDGDVIDVPLGRHPTVWEKHAARPETGKEALTEYHVERQYRGYARVRVLPRTGRTHQIRVHLSLIKHPVAGDVLYGGKVVTVRQLADGRELPRPEEAGGRLGPDDVVLARQALHAARLELRHPVTGKRLVLEAPPPADLQLLLQLLERYRRG